MSIDSLSGDELLAISNIRDLPIDLLMSLLDAYSEVELRRQKDIVMLRRYFDGDQNVELTNRLKEYLGPTYAERGDFRFNLVESIVGAILERLRVRSVDCDDVAQAEWFQILWEQAGFDSLQEDLYESILLEGEHFVMVEWLDGKLDFTLQERYTSLEVDGGTGTGCYMVYPHGDYNKDPLCCVKQWSEFRLDHFVERRNVYYPSYVNKYERDKTAEWALIDVVEYATRGDEPIGIPVVHFTNRRLRSEVWNALPMQDLVNKSIVDLATTSDQTAFRIFYALGFIPTSDGEPPASDQSNWLEVEPGQIIGTNKADAKFGAIDPSDLDSSLKMVHETVLWTAMVTQTPISRFITSGQVARSETLKEQEGPLLSKVLSRQTLFGNDWSDLLKLARRVYNAYNSGEEALDEEVEPKILWQDPELRNEITRTEGLILKRELAVPFEQLWIEAGYTREQIERFLQAEEYERMLAALGPLPGEESLGEQENDDVENLDDETVDSV